MASLGSLERLAKVRSVRYRHARNEQNNLVLVEMRLDDGLLRAIPFGRDGACRFTALGTVFAHDDLGAEQQDDDEHQADRRWNPTNGHETLPSRRHKGGFRAELNASVSSFTIGSPRQSLKPNSPASHDHRKRCDRFAQRKRDWLRVTDARPAAAGGEIDQKEQGTLWTAAGSDGGPPRCRRRSRSCRCR